MRKILMALAVITTGAFFVSCKKENVKANIVLLTETVNELPGDPIIGLTAQGQPYGSGKFTLYSLESKKIIENSDSATTKWDIGFRGTTIITNSGTGGPGNGGAFIHVGVFSDLKSIPADSIFRTDNAPASYAIKTGSGNGWYNYNGATQLVTPIPGRILVIRTANRKYAKLEILNYYKGGVTPDATASDNDKLTKQRYFTFRFIYQPDGTKSF